MCAWEPARVSTGSMVAPYLCVWNKPHFELKTMIEISMFVNFISTPIYYVIGYVVHEILLATSPDDLKRQSDTVQGRRNSLSQFVGAATTATENSQRGRNKFVAFSTAQTVDEALSNTQRVARRSITAGRLRGIVRASGAAGDSTEAADSQTEDKFDSAETLLRNLRSHAATLHHVHRDHFLAAWQVEDATSPIALSQELEDVKKCSEKWKSELKGVPQSTVGVRLLQLFVKDLIGRDSRQANIFENQLTVTNISEKRVVPWGIKCIAFTSLCCLNFYFIFSCMLYGHSKGNSDHFCG